MKKILILIVTVGLLSSCYESFTEIEKDPNLTQYIQYGTTSSASEAEAYVGSPLSYQIYKGQNPYSGYTFKAVSISYGKITFYGDPTGFLNKAFPDADIILSFNNYYYIGYKVK